LLERAYEEYARRREAGEAVDAEAFCDGYPDVRASLFRMVRMHQELSQLAGRQALPPCWPAAGERVGDFTLLRELGRGAFARVFLAREASAGDRPVVVKLSPQGDAEARTLGPLSHPNVVPVLSCRPDPETGLVVVCMPFLGTATLEDVLDHLFRPGARAPRQAARLVESARASSTPEDPPLALPPPHPHLVRGDYALGVLHLGAELAEALAFLHEQGIVHRDLKPSNVLLGPDGRPRLLDFNLAADPDAERARVGGTLPYAAPEHIRALLAPAGAAPAPGTRADLFALGVMLYELLTGTHPFGPVPASPTTEELAALLLQRQRAGCAPLRVPGLDRRAARLIERCLAFDPAARPAGAAELAAGLRAVFTPLRKARRWARRRWWLVAAASLAFVTGAAAWWSRPTPYAAGRVAFRAGRYDEAEQLFTRALEADPADFHAQFARGCARVRAGAAAKGRDRLRLLSEAANDFALVAGQAPGSGWEARACECGAYACALRMAHAESVFLAERAEGAGCRTTALLNNRAYSLILQSKYNEAVPVLEAIDLADRLVPAVCANRAFLAKLRRNAPPQPFVRDESLDEMRRALVVAGDGRDPSLQAADLFAAAAEDASRQTTTLVAAAGPRPELAAPLAAALAAVRDRHLQESADHLRSAILQGYPLRVLDVDPYFEPLADDSRFQALRQIVPPVNPSPGRAWPRLIDPVGDLPE
jgi:serine/threonine protein kinase